jgi:hypothetical protein
LLGVDAVREFNGASHAPIPFRRLHPSSFLYQRASSILER